MSLKRALDYAQDFLCFNAVQNNTSLKRSYCFNVHALGFNAVQNNTSLKPSMMNPS